MNLHQLCQHVILNGLTEDHDGKTLASIEEKCTFLRSRIYSEYGFMIDRVGLNKAAEEWQRGLACSIPFYNGHILEVLGRYDLATYSDDLNVDRYWRALGTATRQLVTGVNRIKKEIEINQHWSADSFADMGIF